MKNTRISVKQWIVATLLLSSTVAFAGPPFTAIEGYGGAAFNPFAYTSGQNKEAGKEPLGGVVSKGQFGLWYVNLGDVDVDWTALGTAFTVADRLELSYSHEIIAPTGENLYKDNIGAKLNVVPENAGGNNAIPAISLGAVAKSISDTAEGVDDNGFDYYAVATKLITQTPLPVLLSGGLLNTKGQVTGVFGFNDDDDLVGFGNIDVLPRADLAIGFEYKQGASFDTFKNADYYDVHAAWFVNKNLTLIGAYVNAGDDKSTSKIGLGDGAVVSAQYAF